MQPFLLGLVALMLALLGLQSFAGTNPTVLAKRVRVGTGVAVLGGAAFMLMRGVATYAIPLTALGVWLLRDDAHQILGSRQRTRAPPPGRTSNVRTEHLEMELDLDTGAMHGSILKGFFAGRAIETLRPVELAHLWQDCRFNDPQSAQLIEAYLDRIHPTWREDMARSEAETPKGPDGRMTSTEALEILGLKPGANSDDVRRAHRELMLKLHPDRGGSTYLSAKINEAKEVLLEE